jgi:hypothetical protein
MKLIREQTDEVRYLVEETNGKKTLYIEGVFMQSEIKNRNGRMYPKSILDREANRYIKEYVDQKRAFGELGHPDTPSINLDRVSHMIVSLKESGNDYVGKARILDTPNGKIVESLISAGARLGVSSRGMGSLKTESTGSIVQDDYYLATAADIVADPSAPSSFVNGIMENADWVLVNGNWQLIEQIKSEVQKANRNQIEEVMLRSFKKFMESL